MNTTRRNLLKAAAAGGASAALGVTIKTKMEARPRPEEDDEHSHGHHIDKAGPLSTATMSFGAWATDPALDRLLVPNPGGARNLHELTPSEVKIQAGGTVNFNIAGVHQIVVYDNGTRPEDINAASALAAPLGALIDDPNRRIYRGLSPFGVPANFSAPGVPAAAIPALPQERIEVVNFPNPGTYLVICGVRNHFKDSATGEFVMFGFVQVLP